MNPADTPIPSNQSQPAQNQQQPAMKWKALLFWASALFALLLALALSIPNPLPNLSLRSLNPQRILKPTLLLRVRNIFHATQIPPISQRPPCVLWMAPFLSGGGYSSEAWSYITALDKHIKNANMRLKIEQHGDLESIEFWYGLPEEVRTLARKLYSTECPMSETIVICHSEPGAWYPPLFQTFPCPPTGYKEPMFIIGRTMFETNGLNAEHVRRCNRMDEVWVPTEFHASTFVKSGVQQSKVVKMVQPVDVEFFNPSKHEALALPVRRPVLGSRAHSSDLSIRKEFLFLSVFKWEYRKGWDVLLTSFLAEFSMSDGVALYLLISAYHSDRDFGSKITKFVNDTGIEEPADGWAPVYVIDTHIPQLDLPRLYKAANVFVLPTRGEGWGRPIVEAMAMALPVITTNWSGPTEYLTEENGYPLPVDLMSEVMEGPFKGHLWAEPSCSRLRALMRHVVSNPEEARKKGRKAREDMIKRFSPVVVAQHVFHQVMKVSTHANRSRS